MAWIRKALTVPALLALAVTLALAQTKPQTAADFYLAYRAVFDKASSVDELLPHMSTENRAKVEATPAEERAEMFEMIKAFGTLKSVKVLKEAKTPQGATLTVEGIDEDGNKMNGTVEIVKEKDQWKLGKERWSGS